MKLLFTFFILFTIPKGRIPVSFQYQLPYLIDRVSILLFLFYKVVSRIYRVFYEKRIFTIEYIDAGCFDHCRYFQVSG